jgi:signal peptidase I
VTETSKPDAVAKAVGGTRLAAVAGGVNVILLGAAVVLQLGREAAPVIAWSAVAALATIAAIVGVLRRMSAAYSPAVVLFYHNAFWSALWAYRAKSFSYLWIACGAAAAAALLLSASRKAFPGLEPPPPKDKDKEKEKDDNFGAWLAENVEAVVVAFIMALVIRCFCIEVFKIPSSSMEPTLMGDHDRDPGDRIMVTKYYYAFNPVERFDVVVFKFPLNQVRNFIKRVVGLPEEEFFVERGNVWTRPLSDPTGKFRIARKPMRVQQSAWIRYSEKFRPSEGLMPPDVLSSKEKFNGFWEPDHPSDEARYEIDRAVLRTIEHKGTKSVRFRYKHDIENGENSRVADQYVAFDLELKDKTGTFYVEIPNEFGRFKLELSAETTSRILLAGPLRLEAPVKPARLVPERRYRVEFMVFDGMAYAIIDGEVSPLQFADAWDDLGPAQDVDKLQFGADGTLFAVANLENARDIYHKERNPGTLDSEHPIAIPADHFIMMGDNVGSSHDSRAWREERFTMKDGTVYRCESQDLTHSWEAIDRWMKVHQVTDRPENYMQADEIGYERFIYDRDVAKHETLDFRFVHRKFLVGKALWIWFPPGRWFRLIR